MALTSREQKKLSRPLTLADVSLLASGASLFGAGSNALAHGVAADDETMEAPHRRTKSKKRNMEDVFLVVGVLGVAAATTMSIRSPRR